MISMWALLTQSDVEAYAATLVLPPYLSHLRLGPFEFSSQVANSDGLEPLEVTYVGEGRLEHFALEPAEHALGMIRSVCPGIDTSRIQLPRNDASWFWTATEQASRGMRVYFCPTTQTLNASGGGPPSPEGYVSVSAGHVFIPRSVVEAYIRAWLRRLGIDDEAVDFEFGTPSGGIEFTADAIGGEMCLDDDVVAEDLMRFSGLDRALADVSNFAQVDLESAATGKCGVFEDGIYISLSKHVGTSET